MWKRRLVMKAAVANDQRVLEIIRNITQNPILETKQGVATENLPAQNEEKTVKVIFRRKAKVHFPAGEGDRGSVIILPIKPFWYDFL